MFREGLLTVVCGPSGVGKGTLLKLLKDRNPNIRFSVSATTRKPREGEIDGQNYFFKTVEEFKEMINNGELVEWVEYCGNYYGTPNKYIKDSMELGYDILLEIEVEGAVHIRDKFPGSVMLFILPPSFAELKKRIENRGTESQEVIEKRLIRAKEEIQCINNFDYAIINEDIEKAVKVINNILESEKRKVKRNKEILKKIGLE